MIFVLDLVNLAAALIILLLGVFSALNKITRATRHSIRAAWIAMTAGAAAVLMGNPKWALTVLLVGMALFLVSDQRKRDHNRPPRAPKPRGP